MQQKVSGTQQAQQAIDDRDEQRVVDNDALSLTCAFTSFRGWQGQKNTAVVRCDLKSLQGERFHRAQKPAITNGNEQSHACQIPCKRCSTEGKDNRACERRSLQRGLVTFPSAAGKKRFFQRKNWQPLIASPAQPTCAPSSQSHSIYWHS